MLASARSSGKEGATMSMLKKTLAVAVLATVAAASCDSEVAPVAPAAVTSATTATGSGGAAGGPGVSSSSVGQGGSFQQTEFFDFPAEPVIEGQLPADIATLFQVPGESSGGPCLAEPPIDAMVPNNWTPLLFDWVGAADQNVYELRLKVDNQVNDLVVYTTASTFTIDAKMWESLTTSSLIWWFTSLLRRLRSMPRCGSR